MVFGRVLSAWEGEEGETMCQITSTIAASYFAISMCSDFSHRLSILMYTQGQGDFRTPSSLHEKGVGGQLCGWIVCLGKPRECLIIA